MMRSMTTNLKTLKATRLRLVEVHFLMTSQWHLQSTIHLCFLSQVHLHLLEITQISTLYIDTATLRNSSKSSASPCTKLSTRQTVSQSRNRATSNKQSALSMRLIRRQPLILKLTPASRRASGSPRDSNPEPFACLALGSAKPGEMRTAR